MRRRRTGKGGCESILNTLQTKVKKEQVIARLEQRIPQLMKDGDVPGLSIALLRDAELVWRRLRREEYKTNEPVADDTVFEAASLSKPVFAYAVLAPRRGQIRPGQAAQPISAG